MAATVNLRPHDRVRVGVETTSQKWPWNLVTRAPRFFYRVHSEDGNIRVRRATHFMPPYDLSVLVTNAGTDIQPRIFRSPRNQLILVFAREDGSGGYDSYEAVSTDFAETWSTPAVSFTGGKYPDVVVDPNTGRTLRLAWVGNKLKATIQERGEAAPGAEFNVKDDAGVDLNLEEDSYHISIAPESKSTYLLSARKTGETVITDFKSTDFAARFAEI